MVVEVIAGEVSENTSCKFQSADSFLGDGMRTDFHECVFASFICHSSQQPVECDRVGGGVFRRNRFVVDIIADGGNKSYFVSEVTEGII